MASELWERMLESVLAPLLVKYLGAYVEGVSSETCKLSLWSGELSLTDLHVKPDALRQLNLPIQVRIKPSHIDKDKYGHLPDVFFFMPPTPGGGGVRP